MFKSVQTPEIKPDSTEDIAIRRVTKLWTTFATHATPNPVEKCHLIDVEWKPANGVQLHFLDIGERLEVGDDPEAERMEFWNDIYRMNPATAKH